MDKIKTHSDHQDYSKPGSFGEVRLGASYPENRFSEGLDCADTGWHRCNSRYHINRENGYEHYIVLFTAAGTGKVEIDGITYSALPDTVIIIPPYRKHAYYVPDGGLWEFYWLQTGSVHAAAVLRNLYGEDPVLHAPCSAFIDDFENGFLRGFDDTNPALSQDACITHVLRILNGYTGTKFAGNDILSVLISEINTSTGFSLPDFCRRHFVTEAHIIRLFTARYGMPPCAYNRRKRLMAAAQQLIHTDIPIGKIAGSAGYGSLTAFGQCFRKQYGISPREYRRQKNSINIDVNSTVID